MAVMPVLAALFFVLAPPQVTNRFMSMFDARDPTRSDRVTMLKVGTAWSRRTRSPASDRARRRSLS
jgi:hypothetical protein